MYSHWEEDTVEQQPGKKNKMGTEYGKQKFQFWLLLTSTFHISKA